MKSSLNSIDKQPPYEIDPTPGPLSDIEMLPNPNNPRVGKFIGQNEESGRLIEFCDNILQQPELSSEATMEDIFSILDPD